MAMPFAEKPCILIVDDAELNRSILTEMLSAEYQILQADCGEAAVSILEKESDNISLLLLDLVMPGMDGFDVMAAMQRSGWSENIPVIVISSENQPEVVERAYWAGAIDFINRPFDSSIVRHRVVNTILLYAKQKQLSQLVEDQVQENIRQNDLMIDILSHIVESRNGESGLHVLHIRALTKFFLTCISHMSGKYLLSAQEIGMISTASALHDIGKIVIPREILNKPGPLTADEYSIMKTHTTAGAAMLESLELHRDATLMKYAYEICRWHHERWDGRGYPDGLVGDNIPISAQVVALADVYDALTSQRSYKLPVPHRDAVAMILRGDCGDFSPLLMDCLRLVADDLPPLLEGQIPIFLPDKTPLKSIFDSHAVRLTESREIEKYRLLARNTGEILFTFTRHPPLLTLPEWSARELGLPGAIRAPLRDPQLRKLLSQESREELTKQIVQATPSHPVAELLLPLTVRGETRWYHLMCVSQWENGPDKSRTQVVGRLTDITELHARWDELERHAFLDELTGLLSYWRAMTLIQQRLASSQGEEFILVIADLDNFKQVNDTYGHHFGNEMITRVAQRFREELPQDCLIARFGGDEFLTLLPDTPQGQEALQRLLQALYRPYGELTLPISLGAARTTALGKDYTTLFLAADRATYAAKQPSAEKLIFYDPTAHRNLLADRADLV